MTLVMYQFKIKQLEDGGYRFELGDIKMLVDDYTIDHDQHLLRNPNKAVAYFVIDNNMYGISNNPMHYNTAEQFFDAISSQHGVFTGDKRNTMGNARA